jgi:hypothetical protein
MPACTALQRLSARSRTPDHSRIEDDAQDGVDHVDGHRTTGWVISPYAKREILDLRYYT